MEIMLEAKKIRIRVRTASGSYVGDFFVPPRRSRVSDAINEETGLFIILTDVIINDTDRLKFLAINKDKIESIVEV
jgi:hypothetical protein